ARGHVKWPRRHGRRTHAGSPAHTQQLGGDRAAVLPEALLPAGARSPAMTVGQRTSSTATGGHGEPAVREPVDLRERPSAEGRAAALWRAYRAEPDRRHRDQL